MAIDIGKHIFTEPLDDRDTKIRRDTIGTHLGATLAKIRHLDLTESLSYGESPSFISGGAYGDIRIGTCTVRGSGSVKVAVKCLRLYLQQRPEVTRLLERELIVWSGLKHPNVLPLLGYSIEENGLPSLVSEFMENGTVLHYVKQRPDVDITGLLLGIAKGVGYLHDNSIVHSDLKSDNVLISPSGEALICDFGVSRVITMSQTLSGCGTRMQHSTGTVRGSVRWMSPELLMPTDNQEAIHTVASDVWAFGMTAYEVLTRKRPYFCLVTDPQVITAIICDHLPDVPEDINTWQFHYLAFWNLCQACWLKDPKMRPKMSHIITRLEDMVDALPPHRLRRHERTERLSDAFIPPIMPSRYRLPFPYSRSTLGRIPGGTHICCALHEEVMLKLANLSMALSGLDADVKGEARAGALPPPLVLEGSERMRDQSPSKSPKSELSDNIPPTPPPLSAEGVSFDLGLTFPENLNGVSNSGTKRWTNSLWSRAFRRRWSKDSR